MKAVLKVVKAYLAKPERVLIAKTDFFGNALDAADTTLLKLKDRPDNEKLFVTMMKACLSSVITVLEQQYDR